MPAPRGTTGMPSRASTRTTPRAFLGRAREHHELGQLVLERQPVGLVGELLRRVVDHRRLADDGPQLGDGGGVHQKSIRASFHQAQNRSTNTNASVLPIENQRLKRRGPRQLI